jgi:hypothetical protein
MSSGTGRKEASGKSNRTVACPRNSNLSHNYSGKILMKKAAGDAHHVAGH